MSDEEENLSNGDEEDADSLEQEDTVQNIKINIFVPLLSAILLVFLKELHRRDRSSIKPQPDHQHNRNATVHLSLRI